MNGLYSFSDPVFIPSGYSGLYVFITRDDYDQLIGECVNIGEYNVPVYIEVRENFLETNWKATTRYIMIIDSVDGLMRHITMKYRYHPVAIFELDTSMGFRIIPVSDKNPLEK